ncbi:hypothetical protein [Bacillus thuringiensis]|uniref:hypothetical protein n=1 Tax=Bacillus thuringiensis TaxID=1428 RepID=UPI000B42E68E|nr:hypothetical protein [Bacillus thuringiensis]MED3180209.1 hypothetical protein [Bacillus thuringiensis]OTY12638.1 hypothetical protein BK734_10725 [Bacillus thuringiensis serovar kim]OUB21239.1 hypothetical protein BK733_04445 [Bacillus thuringiensis serovar xiaguangiensis]
MFRRIPPWGKVILWILAALLSGFVLVIFPILKDLWMEHGSDQTFESIKWIYETKFPLIYMALPIAFFIACTVYIYQQYKKATDEYAQETTEQGKVLLKKYHELRELQFKQTLSLTLEDFCKTHTEITAAQIYKYSKIPRRKSVLVKVNYVDGFVKDQTNLNGMMQKYYEINKNVYKDYHQSIQSFLNDFENIDPLLNFIIKYKNQLDSKPLDDLDYNDAIVYGLISDSYDLLTKHFPETEIVYVDTDKKMKLDEINHKERTGILRGIESELFYEFKYEGNGTKKGRQYITRTITLQNDKHILLITVDVDLVPDEEQQKNERFEALIKEFQDMLHETTEISNPL